MPHTAATDGEAPDAAYDRHIHALLRAWHDAKKHANATVDEFIDFAAARSADEAATRQLLRSWLFDATMPAD